MGFQIQINSKTRNALIEITVQLIAAFWLSVLLLLFSGFFKSKGNMITPILFILCCISIISIFFGAFVLIFTEENKDN
jgi:hypothetical protein